MSLDQQAPAKLWVRLRDLPMPPEVAAVAEKRRRKYFLWWAKDRAEDEDHLKLQHFYGGRCVRYLRTKDGLVVVAASDSLTDPEFDRQTACLSPDERRQAVLDIPIPLFDENSILG